MLLGYEIMMHFTDTLDRLVADLETQKLRPSVLSRKLNALISIQDRQWLEENSLTTKKLVWLILHDANEIPRCSACGGSVAFENGKRFCSTRCSSRSFDVQEKMKRTNIERYGTTNPSQSDEVQRKIRATNMERYGVECVLQSQQVQKKIRETNLELYGAENPFASIEIQKRIAGIMLERYDSTNAAKAEEVKEKACSTSIERYGCKSPLLNEEVRKKALKTFNERYGCDCSAHSEEIKRKTRITKRMQFRQQNALALAEKGIEILSTEEEYAALDEVKYSCVRCGTIFFSNRCNVQLVCCPKCSALLNSSEGEREVAEFIKSLGIDVVLHDRSILNGKEIDILIPSKKVAIEYNGLWWHNFDHAGKMAHYDKTMACKRNGIRLIHIFEWEWSKSRSIVKDIIKKACGCIKERIGASRCKIEFLEQKEYFSFLSENHLQGPVLSSIRIGLKWHGQLVAVAGFGRSRFKENEVELHRFCTRHGCVVVGGLSRLLMHSGCNKVVSYVDLAHFDGRGMEKCGFVLTGKSSPSWKWVKRNQVLSRFQTRKKDMPKLIKEYDSSMTVEQAMSLNGWNQIFDCGTLKMTWTRPE